MNQPTRTHLVVGGFPPGATAGHDMDYARMRLLQFLGEHENMQATVANDFTDVEKWLSGCSFLVTYVAGPYPDDDQNAFIRAWLEEGGRWLALHGTSGGRAARIEGSRRRRMVKLAHHQTLGSFFLTHPPVRRFQVDVHAGHELAAGLPAAFDVSDELYLLEVQDPEIEVLLTTQLEKDPSPPGFGFAYDGDTSLQADGQTRVLGYLHRIGKGGVVYYALGHCHSPASNSQPFVDKSVDPEGQTPLTFRGPWEEPAFERLIRNAIGWCGQATLQ